MSGGEAFGSAGAQRRRSAAGASPLAQGTPQQGTPDESAEIFPRSFRIQRSGSADSLASLVSHKNLLACIHQIIFAGGKTAYLYFSFAARISNTKLASTLYRLPAAPSTHMAAVPVFVSSQTKACQCILKVILYCLAAEPHKRHHSARGVLL